jgi:hypothetical protein
MIDLWDALVYSYMNEGHANPFILFVKDVVSHQDPCAPEPPMHTIVVCTLHFVEKCVEWKKNILSYVMAFEANSTFCEQ